MPTEGFNLHVVTPLAEASFANAAGTRDQQGSPLVESIRDCLLNADWTVVDSIRPTGTLFFYVVLAAHNVDPLEVPLPIGSRRTSGGGPLLRLNVTGTSSLGTPIYAYNPNRELPRVGALSFPVGVSIEDTVDNAISALSATGLFSSLTKRSDGGTGDPNGSWYVDYELATAGTAFNNYCIEGDFHGSYVVGSTAAGGAYVLRSQTYRGTQVEVTLTERSAVGNPDGRVRCEFEVVGTVGKVQQTLVTYNAGDTSEFRHYTLQMIANPYQFALFNSGNETGGSAGSTSLLCSIPWRPDDDAIGTGYCAIIIGSYYNRYALPSGSLRSSLVYWVCFAALEGPLVELANDAIGIAMTRYPGEWGLRTTSLKPIIQTAYLGVRPQWEDAEGQRILGCLWGAALISDKFATTEPMTAVYSGYRWTHAGSQAGVYNKTQGSLWLASDTA
jgi:hypothetical protein